MDEQIKQFVLKNKVAIGLILLLLVIFNGIQYVQRKKDVDDTKVEEKVKKEEKEDVEKSTSTPILYKVTKEGLNNTLYLFGSIHVADDRAYPMPELVMDAYNNSDSLAVEFDIITYSKDLDAQIKSLEKLVLTDGTKVDSHLTEETYNLMVDYLKDNNMYSSMYDYYKPAIHYSLISSVQAELSGLDSNKGIDMFFLEKAHKEKKEILEVESADLQYNILASMPDELYEVLIKTSIENEDDMINDVKELYELWLKGDVSSVVSLLQEEDEIPEDFNQYENLETLMNNYNNALIYERNTTMTDRAIEYFESGKNVFFVVGLAHIVGDDAMAKNLENAGYIVELLEYE